MKQIGFSLTALGAAALLAFSAGITGCASTTTSNTQSKETMLAAAGFKVVTPKTAAQQTKLKNLPPGKIAMIQKSKKTFYVYPDAAHNQAYVGGPAEYQAYQQARAAAKLSQENYETAAMYEDTMMGWNTWGGWGVGWGPMGMGRF
jgi:hypothetical protein